MRSIARMIATILATLGTLTWELVNGAWTIVRKAFNPAVTPPAAEDVPVSEAEAIAEQILAADDKAKASRAPGSDGVTHRHPLGMSIGMAARGFDEHLRDVPDNLRVWLASLGPAERIVLAALGPDQIENHLSGLALIRGLPGVATQAQSDDMLRYLIDQSGGLLAESRQLREDHEAYMAQYKPTLSRALRDEHEAEDTAQFKPRFA